MEFMKIGSNSLKITMNAREAKNYDLSDSALLDGEETKRTFEKLLIRAKKEIGYQYAGQKVVAEIFSSKNGGCEIFLSYAEDTMYKEINPKDIGTKQKKSVATIYVIDKFEYLLDLAYGLNKMEYRGKSSVYYDTEQESYYIILDDVSSKDERHYFVSEFAKIVKNGKAAYLREHFKCLVNKNAVKVFAQLK